MLLRSKRIVKMEGDDTFERNDRELVSESELDVVEETIDQNPIVDMTGETSSKEAESKLSEGREDKNKSQEDTERERSGDQLSNMLRGILNEFKEQIQSQIQTQHSQTHEKIDQINSQISSRMETQINGINTQFQTQQMQIHEKIDQINSQISNRMETQISGINTQIQTQQSQIHEQISQINSQISSRDESIKETLETIKENVNLIRGEVLVEVERNISQIRGEIEMNRVEVENKVDRIQSELEKQRGQAENNLDIIRRDMKAQEGQMTTLENKFIVINTELELVNQRMQTAEQSLRNQLREMDDDRERLETRLNNMNSQLESLGPRGVTYTGAERRNESRGISPDLPGPSSSVPNNVNLREHHIRSSTQNFVLNEISMPKFANKDNEHPIRFLRELEHFFELRAVPSELRNSVLRHSLYGDCLNWYDLQITDDMPYSEVRNQFVAHFWDEVKQSECRWEVIHGRYDTKKFKCMADYFMKMGQKAKYLDPEIPTSEFLAHMANHFPSDIRSALIISKPRDAKEMLRLLKELQPSVYGNASFHDRQRDERNPVKKTEQNSFSKGRAPPHINCVQGRDENQILNRQAPRQGNQTAGGSSGDYGQNNSNHYDRNGNRNNNQNRGGNQPGRRNNNGFRNNNWNQNRNPRIHYIDLTNDREQRDYRPHWWRRRAYNNYWRPRNYFHRYNPYRNNYRRERPNNDRPENAPNENGGAEQRVGELIRNQNNRRDLQDPNFHGGDPEPRDLNAEVAQ